jgi:signal transduction histidine kinase
MTKIFTLVLFTFIGHFSHAQLNQIDSLKRQLADKREDSNKVQLNIKLCWAYLFNQTDSAFFYGQQALQLAKKIEFIRGEAEAYGVLMGTFFVKGDYAQAMDYTYKSMRLYEKLKDKSGIADAHIGLCNIYRDQGNLKRALEHILIAKSIIESNKMDANTQLTIHGNLGNIYEQDNQLDSDLVHCQKAYEAGMMINNGTGDYTAFVIEVIGNIHLKRKKYNIALQYYRKTLPLFIFHNDIKEIINVNNSIATIFLQLGKIDSALFYAKKALYQRKSSSYIKGIQHTSELLAEIFKEKGLSDSVLKYLELSYILKDSIYSQVKEREVQNLAFNEHLRQQELLETKSQFNRQLWKYGIIAIFLAGLTLVGVLWRNNQQKQQANVKIEKAYKDLKDTQHQLIQSEKMASLGELTAGIAHEIQNPLNFVNNFSEVSTELVDEMNIEIDKGNLGDVKNIANDLKQNLEKINQHGKRAGDIVKGMLQHSRTSSGQKEPTNINALADEYLRLAYHGLRAKDKSFNATLKTYFDETIGNINIIPQDIGRVVLNVITNAFYVVDEKKKAGIEGYEPTVEVSTKKISGKVEIKVADNGNGIPQKVLDKIFQPFFTTKPTGQGTGLGLSLSYDIVKAHGGELKVETKEGEGSQFIIILPA